MEFAFSEFPQIDLTSNFQPLISSVGGAGEFLRAGILSRACWQIIAGQGDGCSQRRFSCSHCAPLTEETGGALGFTRPRDVRVPGRLRHPCLRPAAPPVSHPVPKMKEDASFGFTFGDEE